MPTFGLAVEKEDPKGFNDGFREVYLVEKDGQDTRYRISYFIGNASNCEDGAEWLPKKIFDNRFRLLNAEEMKLFTDDSHITQLLYPSPRNLVHIHYKGGKFLSAVLCNNNSSHSFGYR